MTLPPAGPEEFTASSTDSRLRMGNSCRRFLIWECEVVESDAALKLAHALKQQGYEDRSRSTLVLELEHPDEHSVVIVPRTGRLQIRVHYMTPFAEREAEALKVAREIVGCLRRL